MTFQELIAIERALIGYRATIATLDGQLDDLQALDAAAANAFAAVRDSRIAAGMGISSTIEIEAQA